MQPRQLLRSLRSTCVRQGWRAGRPRPARPCKLAAAVLPGPSRPGAASSAWPWPSSCAASRRVQRAWRLVARQMAASTRFHTTLDSWHPSQHPPGVRPGTSCRRGSCETTSGIQETREDVPRRVVEGSTEWIGEGYSWTGSLGGIT